MRHRARTTVPCASFHMVEQSKSDTVVPRCAAAKSTNDAVGTCSRGASDCSGPLCCRSSASLSERQYTSPHRQVDVNVKQLMTRNYSGECMA